ncbi:MAG: VPLPA-CTERM sorting domain-containing protein [Gammaproteobacteria bacterium]|nr:VPLPA-CTERM sorting domain-containing protein [Gammaproteobacteria bacterium]
MKFQSALKYTASLFLLTIANVGHTELITYTDRTAWESVGTVLFTEDFEGYRVDTSYAATPLNVGPFTLATIGSSRFDNNFVDVPRFKYSGIPASFGNAAVSIYVEGPLATDIIFNSPVNGFFADFLWPGNGTSRPLRMTLSLLGGGTLALSVPGVGATLEHFGFFSSDAITSIRLSNGANDGIMMDNIAVSAVPVPAAVWLFGSGLIGLIGIARRKTV